ncbi:hypothetical protein R6Q57_012051 [Mikania cordata]
MNSSLSRFISHSLLPPNPQSFTRIHVHFACRRTFRTVAVSESPEVSNEKMVVVGGGAAGIYGAIRAKTLAPNLNVVVIEKGKPLAKVKISGGGRCNVTNGHCADNLNNIQGVVKSSEVHFLMFMDRAIQCHGFLNMGSN